MKRILAIYAVLIIAVIFLAIVQFGSVKLPFFGRAPSATIEGKKFSLILAKTDSEREKGLSGRGSLAKNTGMLFIFPEKARYKFWMKDMKFPIDIIYINDKRVVDIIEDAPVPQPDGAIPTFEPREQANYVLEVNADNHFKIGDTVTFENVK